MALIEILMPQMGESVMEATIISWLKKEGERVDLEEPLLEVATDKVDTEVPAIQEGFIKEFLAKEGDVIQIGSPIAILSTDGAEIDFEKLQQGNGVANEPNKVNIQQSPAKNIEIEPDKHIEKEEYFHDIPSQEGGS